VAASINDKATKSYSFLTKSLSSGINNTDTTIPFNNVTNIPTDTAVHFVIDRVDSNGNRTPTLRELCKGVVSGSNLINCTRGLHGTTAQSHLSGAVVEFSASAVGWNELIDAVIAEHSQVDGTHSTTLITSRTEDTAPDGVNDLVLTYDNSATALKKVKIDNIVRNNTQITSGWTSSLLPAVSSVTYNGNRSYDVTFSSTVASYLTPGMRVRTSRTVAAPTQCTSLNGTTQYYNKTSPNKSTFTDDFNAGAWVKLSSYPGSAGAIISRYNGTSGWRLYINGSGQVLLQGHNGGLGNSSYVYTYQSLPLNKWVHVAGQLDMSAFTATTTTSYIMFDGVDVPCAVARNGTNPTALVQAGDLAVGAANSTDFFPGKIAQAWYSTAKVTQAQIRSEYMCQTISASATNLGSAYSFNNSIADLNTTTPNDLTAQGSAVATNADSPFSLDATGTPGGTYDFGIVTKVATTVATIQFPEGSCPPTSGGVSAVDLSAYKSPFGFPAQRDRWNILLQLLSSVSTSGTSVNTTYNPGGLNLNVPVGNWNLTFESQVTVIPTATTPDLYSTLSTSSSAFTIGSRFNVRHYIAQQSGSGTHILSSTRSDDVSVSSATPYYILLRTPNAFSNMTVRGDITSGVGETTSIVATPAHL